MLAESRHKINNLLVFVSGSKLQWSGYSGETLEECLKYQRGWNRKVQGTTHPRLQCEPHVGSVCFRTLSNVSLGKWICYRSSSDRRTRIRNQNPYVNADFTIRVIFHSHREGHCLIPGYSMWDLWQTVAPRQGFLRVHLYFPVSIIPPTPYTQISCTHIRRYIMLTSNSVVPKKNPPYPPLNFECLILKLFQCKLIRKMFL